jgi:hypothetical protein
MEGETFEDWLIAKVMMILVLPAFIGPGIFAWQCFVWLRYGYWHPVPVAAAFQNLDISYPRTEWAGVRKMIDWVLELPLSLTAWLLWVGVFASVIAFIDAHNRRKRITE